MKLRERVMEYLKRLDEGEDAFNELVKDLWWIADYYTTE
jgi:hypothetical protein